MSFKDSSYLELWWPLSSAEQSQLHNYARGSYEKHITVKLFEFGMEVQEEMLFIECFCRALVTPLFSQANPFVQGW